MEKQTIAKLERRLQLLEDIDSLRALLHRVCSLADKHEWDKYIVCFLEDGVVQFENWPGVRGHEDILAQIKGPADRFQGLQHSLSNVELSVEGDNATGECYLWFTATKDTTKPHEYHGFGGPYTWTFKRTNTGWKISSLHLRKIWSQNPNTEGVFGG